MSKLIFILVLILLSLGCVSASYFDNSTVVINTGYTASSYDKFNGGANEINNIGYGYIISQGGATDRGVHLGTLNNVMSLVNTSVVDMTGTNCNTNFAGDVQQDDSNPNVLNVFYVCTDGSGNKYVKYANYNSLTGAYTVTLSSDCTASITGTANKIGVSNTGAVWFYNSNGGVYKFGLNGTACNSLTTWSPHAISDNSQFLRCGNKYHMLYLSGTTLYDDLYLPTATVPSYIKTSTYDTGLALTKLTARCNINDAFNVGTSNIYITTLSTDQVNYYNLLYEDGTQSLAWYKYAFTENTTSMYSIPNVNKASIVETSEGLKTILLENNTALYSLRQYDYCYTNIWTNTTCYNGLMRQERIVIPSDCADSVRYVDSVVCEREYNGTIGVYQQQVAPYYNQTECTSDGFVHVGTVAECTMVINNVPLNCQNVNITTYPTVEFNLLTQGQCKGSGAGDVSISSCNPSYDCNTNRLSCQDINEKNNASFTNPKSSSYLVGNKLKTSVSVLVNPSCQCPRFCVFGLCSESLKMGVDTYRVRGTTIIKCDLPCEEKNVCKNKDYLGIQHIDCTITNETQCDYGCLNGRCLTATDTGTNIINPINDPVSTLFNGISNAYNLSANSKFILWSAFTLLITGGLYTKFSDSKNNSVVVGLGLLIMFGIGFWAGWLPPILLVIIAIGGLVAIVIKH